MTPRHRPGTALVAMVTALGIVVAVTVAAALGAAYLFVGSLR